MKKSLILLFSLFLSIYSYSNVRLPRLISDNMVLQREKPIILWGWADAGEKVTVQFNKQTKSVKTDKSGKWLITLGAEQAGGPFIMTVKGKNTITINNILVGEVWVCSGQSNMEFHVRSVTNAEGEIKNNNYPQIRQFEVQKSVSGKPEEEVEGGDWKAATPEHVGDFTAVGFFFARDVYDRLKIPIGLIHTSWGGTHSETWTSREAFEQSDDRAESDPEDGAGDRAGDARVPQGAARDHRRSQPRGAARGEDHRKQAPQLNEAARDYRAPPRFLMPGVQ